MTFYIILVITLTLFSACFSGFENGMIAIRKPRLDHALANNARPAKLIKHLLDRPNNMLATILLGNNLCNCFAAIYFDSIVGSFSSAWWASAIASGFLTFIVLIFGEITPKVWFRQKPYVRCSYMVYPMFLFYIVAWPISRLLTVLVDGLNRLTPRRGGNSQASPALMREDFRMMLLESEEQHLIDHEARQLLDNALDYHNNTVADRLIPREEIIPIHVDMTLADAIQLAEKHDLSRFPVSQNHLNQSHWIGTFSVYDAYFRVPREEWASATIRDWVRPAVNIRDTAPLNSVLTLARVARTPILLVIDANGRQIGVITPADVISPLFGDLEI